MLLTNTRCLSAFFSLLLVFSMMAAYAQEPQKKIPLSVLYVGYEPSRPMPESLVYYTTSPALYPDVYKNRMADFRRFLEHNFTTVTTVDARDYTVAMSEKVDVTVMDGGPVNIPANFDRPMVLMSAMAPKVGLPIKLKFDWYCQCLDADALNVRTSHPIFNTPNKVNLTFFEGTTPESFFNGWEGKNTPKTMPMWKVLKAGMSSNPQYLIGMVSHGEGFDDSPDAEAISGGVCWKNAEAVSIGRHGNYLMWGFSGSPDYMTDEANQVLVNAICYIRKYDHMPVIVRKKQETTRSGLDELMYRLDKNVFNQMIASMKIRNERLGKMQDGLRARKAAGEDIGQGNENLLKMQLSNDYQTWDDYVLMYAGADMVKMLGTDPAKYQKFYADNYEYYYPAGTQSLRLDTDAQSLGISNRKQAILEKCITMLEKKQQPALAQRVLERYTVEKFKTAADWRKWYTKNSNNLFYTEAGGFKFMVNNYGKRTVPATSKQTAPKLAGKQPTALDPVVISAMLVPGGAAESTEVLVKAKIFKGWHIYAYVPKESPFITTETLLELPVGASSERNWVTSAARPYPDSEDLLVYEDSASFRVKVDLSGVIAGAEIQCGLYYQACDINKCYQPLKKMVTLKYQIQSAAGTRANADKKNLATKKHGVAIHQPAPDFSLKNAEGTDINLSSYKGKPLLLEFWASWCMPCRASIPHLKEVYRKYHDAGFEILSVSIDASKAAWTKAMNQEGMNWVQVMDKYTSGNKDAEVAYRYGVQSVPANFLIDGSGRIVALDLKDDMLDKKLEELFRPSPSQAAR